MYLYSFAQESSQNLLNDFVTAMENPNLIVCLFPADGNSCALDVISNSDNALLYIFPQKEREVNCRSRESTASLSREETGPDYGCYPSLQLTFNPEPKSTRGFIFGTDRNCCDIIFPQLRYISRRHCSITFDEKRRLVLHDLSRHGTIVTYDGKGGEKRRNFTWILSGDEALPESKIILQIQDIRFHLIVSRPKMHQDLYIANVDRFLQAARGTNEPSFGPFGIHSTKSTASQSGTQTPQAPIYIFQEELGRGGFSIVNRIWDVSTGSLYASKEFRNINGFDWELEVSNTRKASLISPVSKEIPFFRAGLPAHRLLGIYCTICCFQQNTVASYAPRVSPTWKPTRSR